MAQQPQTAPQGSSAALPGADAGATTSVDDVTTGRVFDTYQQPSEVRIEPDGPASLIDPWQAMELARRTVPGSWETPALRSGLIGSIVWLAALISAATGLGLLSWWVAAMLAVLFAGGISIGLVACRWWFSRGDTLIDADRRFWEACQAEEAANHPLSRANSLNFESGHGVSERCESDT